MGMNGGSPLRVIDVERFLLDQGIRNVMRSGDEVSFSCPFDGHKHGDQRPSARMNVRSTAWICHGCHRTGNAVSFVRDLSLVSEGQAISWITEWQGGRLVRPNETVTDALRRVLSDPPARLPEADLTAAWANSEAIFYHEWGDWTLNSPPQDSYMYNRGFSKETLNHYGIGFDAAKSRVTIPIRNEHGRTIGIKGRTIVGAEPKYLIYQPVYSASRVLYLMDSVLVKGTGITICEGELNALKMRQLGFCNTVGLGGSIFSPAHSRFIIDNFTSAVLFFDSDSSGFRGRDQAIALLRPYMNVKVVDNHDGDPATMTRAEIATLIDNAQDTLTRMLRAS